METLSTVLTFAVAIILSLGLVITVHEWGHYIVAKKLGIKILRFSIGFGQPLYRRPFGPDKTEFIIAALPVGGYVQMLDEREGEVPEEEVHRAFNRQKLWKRAAVVFAGPAVNLLSAILIYAVVFGTFGVSGMRPVIEQVAPDSVAAKAGMVAGDVIVAVEDRPVLRWTAVVENTLKYRLAGETLRYEVEDEQGYSRRITVDLAELSVDDFTKGEFFTKLGITRAMPRIPPVVAEVVKGGAAEKAGMLAGDRVVAVKGEAVESWRVLTDHIQENVGVPLPLTVLRGDSRHELSVIPAEKEGQGFIGIRAQMPEIWPPPGFLVHERYGPLEALWQGAVKTWDMISLSLRVMAKMLTLEVSVENLSGPITIAEFAGKSFSLGWDVFLGFLGLISVSLGIVNLFPIPILDGGHLFTYLIEWIKGSPLSERAEILWQKVGLVMLAMLMSLALFNDLNRLFQFP